MVAVHNAPQHKSHIQNFKFKRAIKTLDLQKMLDRMQQSESSYPRVTV
jgi:hypothetical protein